LEVVDKKMDKVSQLKPALRCWTNFFYYADKKSEEEMTVLLQGHPVVEHAYEEYKRFNNDVRMRELDEAHQRYLHDYATDMETAEAKGRAEGKIETARNSKRLGIDYETIAKATGLSVEEINRLD
jgi:predicted transposase/invertase (TIGR01784 family)